MSFRIKYPTEKTEEEKEMEFKGRLSTIVGNALRKTALERGEGLKLTSSQIDKMVSLMRRIPFDSNRPMVATLEGIQMNRIHLKDN